VLGTGSVAPGNSPGKLSTGNIVLNSGTTFNVDIAGATAGTQYDQLAVTGTVDLGGATLTINASFTPTSGQVIKIVDNDGTGDAVTGTFNGLPQNATVNVGGSICTISYVGGDGNDVVLKAPGVAIPPPTVTNPVLFDAETGSNASVTIDGVADTTQRSEIRRMIVNFSEAVTFSGSVTTAFTLARSANSHLNPANIGNVTLTASPASGSASSVTISFSGSFADSTGSLIDGMYDLTIDASKISGAGGLLNGSGGGAGTNYTNLSSSYVTTPTPGQIWRLYGDANGSGQVDQSFDFTKFRNAFGLGPSPFFDYDNSGNVDQAVDFVQFRNNFGLTP